jgi:ribulose-5-phosphate 4-epimerase/fuculose-1-phosphate aldolase
MMGVAGLTILPAVDPEIASAVAHEPVMFDEDKALIRSVDQGVAVAKRMKGANACHLQNHGMVFTGPNVQTVTAEAIAIEHEAEITWRAHLIGKPEAVSELALRPSLDRRSRGEVAEAWEYYWRWVDKNPESLRPRSADI